jgi:hypothetical protein
MLADDPYLAEDVAELLDIDRTPRSGHQRHPGAAADSASAQVTGYLAASAAAASCGTWMIAATAARPREPADRPFRLRGGLPTGDRCS